MKKDFVVDDIPVESLVKAIEREDLEFSPLKDVFDTFDNFMTWMKEKPLAFRVSLLSKTHSMSLVKRSRQIELLHDLPADHGLDDKIGLMMTRRALHHIVRMSASGETDIDIKSEEEFIVKILTSANKENVEDIISCFNFTRNMRIKQETAESFNQLINKLPESFFNDSEKYDSLFKIICDNTRCFSAETISLFLGRVKTLDHDRLLIEAFKKDALTGFEISYAPCPDPARGWFVHGFVDHIGLERFSKLVAKEIKKEKEVKSNPSHILKALDYLDKEMLVSEIVRDDSGKLLCATTGEISQVIEKIFDVSSEKITEMPSLSDHIGAHDNFHYYVKHDTWRINRSKLAAMAIKRPKEEQLSMLVYHTEPRAHNIFPHTLKKGVNKNEFIFALANNIANKDFVTEILAKEIGIAKTVELLGEELEPDTIAGLRAIFKDVSGREFSLKVKGASRHALSHDLGI